LIRMGERSGAGNLFRFRAREQEMD
jgi:hypothetical protein